MKLLKTPKVLTLLGLVLLQVVVLGTALLGPAQPVKALNCSAPIVGGGNCWYSCNQVPYAYPCYNWRYNRFYFYYRNDNGNTITDLGDFLYYQCFDEWQGYPDCPSFDCP